MEKRNLYQNEKVTQELEQAYSDYIDGLNSSHNYCRCDMSMIKCDNRGCHCERCGGHQKTIPDMDYLTWLELRFKVQENTITKLQTKLDDIKIWYQEAKDTPTQRSVIPTPIWQLLQRLGELFGK